MKCHSSVNVDADVMSLPAWGAWIEMKYMVVLMIRAMSLPRGGWIEMRLLGQRGEIDEVAPRVGGVD